MDVHSLKRHAYKEVRNLTEEKFGKHAGLIFERMIKNIFLQIMFDKSELGIKIEDVNVIEDVEGKIDFVIKFKKRTRGAAIEEKEGNLTEGKKVLGIQFTILSEDSPYYQMRGKFKNKIEQIRRVKESGMPISHTWLDDIILISVPVSVKEIIRRYQQWKQLGKPPGGPEALWDINTRISFIKAVLQKMGVNDLLREKEDELFQYYNSRLAKMP